MPASLPSVQSDRKFQEPSSSEPLVRCPPEEAAASLKAEEPGYLTERLARLLRHLDR